ncbi:MAG: Stp1/IreP family PP2C-type Ser/Thr phosphatase [Proteobacteria bacterium]|nr:Stp1/IreP family PP2C-type Ser/Thr phosphatase [Pseudomonadota bacterium]
MSEVENTNNSASKAGGATSIEVNVFGRTDVGLVRDHNEDNFLVADLTRKNRSIKPEVREHIVGERGSLFVVCDGMGGAAAGEVASQIAVDTIYEMMLTEDPPKENEELARRLEAAITEAGMRIFTSAKMDRKRRGMGTTVTAAVMIGPRIIIGQVGDSRAYVYRKGELIQVTKDQSLVQQLLDAKQLTEEEARNFGRANIILQALGTSEEVRVDITSAVLRLGDVFVMCSDGLCGVVESDAISAVMEDDDEPMETCRKLTDLACEGGGHDNITVIVSRFNGAGLSEPIEDEELSYKKFQYSSSVEITMRSRLPKSKEKAEDKPADEEPAPPEEARAEVTSEVTEKRGVLGGLIAAVMAVLLVVVALFTYTMLLDKTMDNANENHTVVPLNKKAPVSASHPDNRVQAVPLDTTPKVEPADEPALSPTPEAAMTDTGDELSASNKPEKTNENVGSLDVEEPSDLPLADKAIPEKKQIGKKEHEQDSLAGQAEKKDSFETVAKMSPSKETKVVKATEEAAKDKPVDKAEKSKKTKKMVSKKEEDTKPDIKEVIKPGAIDDNPF